MVPGMAMSSSEAMRLEDRNFDGGRARAPETWEVV